MTSATLNRIITRAAHDEFGGNLAAFDYDLAFNREHAAIGNAIYRIATNWDSGAVLSREDADAAAKKLREEIQDELAAYIEDARKATYTGWSKASHAAIRREGTR